MPRNNEMYPDTKIKRITSDDINADIEKFLAKGGKIEKIDYGVSGDASLNPRLTKRQKEIKRL